MLNKQKTEETPEEILAEKEKGWLRTNYRYKLALLAAGGIAAWAFASRNRSGAPTSES